MENFEITRKFLAMIEPRTKKDILQNIAGHYGISSAEAFKEVTDPEAEHLLDYFTGPTRSATSVLMRRHGLWAAPKTASSNREFKNMTSNKQLAHKLLKIAEQLTASNMKSMTYGQMPSYEEFSESFDENVENPRGFSFRNDKRVGMDILTKRELWKELCEAAHDYDEGDEDAGDWCSAVLSTLNFEWV